MVLLDLYVGIGQDLTVINVEHGVRGETSERDSEFVRDYCRKNGVDFIGCSVNVPEIAAKAKKSIELAARETRYKIFDGILNEGKIKKIALAHHADDNAETVLMRIFRGTGIRGLAGISERGNYIRPLLDYTREDIEDYAERHGVPHVSDETNSDEYYARNYIRRVLLPRISERYPEAVVSINRLSRIAKEINGYFADKIIRPKTENGRLRLEKFFGTDPVVAKYSCVEAVKLFGVYKDMENVNLEDVTALKNKENNSSVSLPFGITAIKYGEDLILSRRDFGEFLPEPFSLGERYSHRGSGYRFRPGREIVAGISFDPDKVSENAVIRERERGDRFRKVNGRDKLLSDFLNEKKLNSAEKSDILLLADGKRVLAILGTETAEEIKIDENTKKIYHVIKEKDL